MLTLVATQTPQPLPPLMERSDISLKELNEMKEKIEKLIYKVTEVSKVMELVNSVRAELSELTSKSDCTSTLYESRGFAGSPEKCKATLFSCPEDSVVRRIADAVGGVESFCRFPVLTLDQNPEDTINVQKPEDIIDIQINPPALSDSLMRGVGRFGRSFIALKAQDGQEENVEVFFQRRPDDSESWIRRNPHDPLNCDGFIANDKEFFEKLSRLAVPATDNSENKS